eukprot:CAMPEP_0171937932 /NCGR_PEP_ID=MMETSP0993-20121228/35023_1 /TAXON_ID=483369 /ORGANISM="non described non described, Strain CCMP2098" /LENGTH=375 /DNA_ID=CAMNT_0012579385 /DNA_START=1 /DNA_END=1128 /DNA_ORIENTATION=-
MSEMESTNALVANEEQGDSESLPRPQGEGGKEGAGTGRGSHNLKPFFWDLVWPVLAENGWTLEPGLRNRPGNDFYFMPPGVDRRNTRYRVDYFDSVSGVLRCIAGDDRFGSHVQAYAAAEEQSRVERQKAVAERRLEKQRSQDARPKRPPSGRDYRAERAKRIAVAQDVAAQSDAGGGRGRRVHRKAPAKYDPSDHDRRHALANGRRHVLENDSGGGGGYDDYGPYGCNTNHSYGGGGGYGSAYGSGYGGYENGGSGDSSRGCFGNNGGGGYDGNGGFAAPSQGQRSRAPSMDGTPPDVLASLLLSLSGAGAVAPAADARSTSSTSSLSTDSLDALPAVSVEPLHRSGSEDTQLHVMAVEPLQEAQPLPTAPEVQ